MDSVLAVVWTKWPLLPLPARPPEGPQDTLEGTPLTNVATPKRSCASSAEGWLMHYLDFSAERLPAAHLEAHRAAVLGRPRATPIAWLR
jgi:hypothetical protein